MAAVFEVTFNYVRANSNIEKSVVTGTMPEDSRTLAAINGQEAINVVTESVANGPLATRGRKSDRITGIAVVGVKLISILDL